MRLFQISILVTIACFSLAFGSNVLATVENIPVQYEGRMMPFSSFARELVLGVSGKQALKGETATETVMRWLADPHQAYKEPLFSIKHQDLLQELGETKKATKYNLEELLEMHKLMQLSQESSRIKSQDGKPTKAQSEASKIVGKLGYLYALLGKQIPGYIPDANDPMGSWLPLMDQVSTDDSVAIGIRDGVTTMVHSYSKGHDGQLIRLSQVVNRLVRARWNPGEERLKRFDVEIMYNSYRPIQFGRNLYLFGFVLVLCALFGWSSRFIFISSWVISAGLAAHTIGLIMRTYVGDRAPWSNFYESLVTLVALLVLFGLLFAKGRMRGLILGAVALSGFASLLIADRAGLSPGIDTLAPALQSYWLTIHVIIIMAGYAAAMLAMVLGHVVLGVEAFKPKDSKLFIASTEAVYRAVQMAMLFIFVGTVLGGVWAHEAWGRYWGWDPKETWALISWFAYLGVAHARFAGWLSPRGLALAAIGVFPIILMTYYGVNYMLSGLHSYAGGESASVPFGIILFLAIEAVVVYAGFKGWHLKFSKEKK